MSTRTKLVLFSVILMLSLACNFASSLTDTAPAPEEDMEIEEAGAPASVDNTVENEPVEEDAPAPPEADVKIEAAGAPVTPNCDLFNVEKLNAIAGEEFSFVGQDQLGSCSYKTENNFQLLVGGGKPISAQEARTQFDKIFGKLPNAKWKAFPAGFQLGIAPTAGAGITAQGVSQSGHTLMILTVGNPNIENSQKILLQLAEEAARQLNGQW